MHSFTLQLLSFAFVFTTVFAGGEITIHHSPNGINFIGNEPIEAQELPSMLLSAMGFSSDADNTWEGLAILDPFNYPKMTVLIEVNGLPSLNLTQTTYPLHSTTNLHFVKDILDLKLESKLLDESDLIPVDINDDLKLQTLNMGDEAVAELIQDLGLLKSLNEKITTETAMESIWIQLKGLNNIIHEYGKHSEQSSEAANLLKNALDKLESTLQNVYNDKFLMVSITEEHHHSRQTRNVKAEKDEPLVGNLSKRYGTEYSAIFNIILWMSIFLIAALISTAVFICTLDPGRDSIIYRMTTQRIKKEN